MSVIAAWLVCGLLGGLAIFQAALALGAPIGHFAWGGQHRVLPLNLRIGSIIAIGLYALFAAIVLQRAGVVSWLPEGVADIGIWVVFGYTALGIPMNAISRSMPEKLTMTPLVALLTGLIFVIAMGW